MELCELSHDRPSFLRNPRNSDAERETEESRVSAMNK